MSINDDARTAALRDALLDRIVTLERWKAEAEGVFNRWDAVYRKVPDEFGEHRLGQHLSAIVGDYIDHLQRETK